MRTARKFLLFLTVAYALQGCVFIQQARESRKSTNKETTALDALTEKGEKAQKDDANIVLKEVILPIVSDNQDHIWYHPNPWWKIKTRPFPVSADSFQYRMMRPQYGFPVFNQADQMPDKTTWTLWLEHNKMYDDPSFQGHAWQGFINSNKETFIHHPEYLAEINGLRPGFGKSNKLCVTNADLPALFASYLQMLDKKSPNRKFFSVEPSDGGNFCECKECSKLGSISNQVFYLANEVAVEVAKKIPDKMVNLYAYNLHSDTPAFRLDKNLLVAVVPGGFQTICPPNSMLTMWAKKHNNLYWRDYFGIPQWTSDLPRIDVESYLTRTSISRNKGYKALIMESGMNLNAALLYVLFNAKWMNDTLQWDTIFDKFINDCFPESKVPMRRLFTRWHHSWLGKDEYPATLYDLNEAWNLAKEKFERQRLADVTAYARMMHLLYLWLDNREEDTKLEDFAQYVLRLGSRNLVHPRAMLTAYNKHFKNADLKKKYHPDILKNHSFKYLSDEEVMQNFRSDLSKVKPQKNDFQPLWMKDIKNLKLDKTNFSRQFSTTMKDRSLMHVFTDTTLTFNTLFNPKNINDSALITVNNHDNTFHLARIMKHGDSWSVPISQKDALAVQVHRTNSVSISLTGRFIPILNDSPAKPMEGLSIYSHHDGWKRLNPGEKILNTNPYYFLFRE